MAQRIGGTVFFKINGAQYSVRGKAEIYPFTTKKTAVIGDVAQGFTETALAPGFKIDITDLGNVSVQQLQSLSAGTMTFEANSGKSWILINAWCEGEITVNQDEGSYTAEFRGLAMNEQLAF